MDCINKVLIIIIIVLVLFTFYTQVREHYYQDENLTRAVDEVCEYFPKAKRLKYYVGDESYTINKEKVYICIKDKNTQKVYDDNILKYVILHEYTHSICPEIGHTPLYHEMFDKVLKKAIKDKLYDPNVKIPPNYCK